MCFSPEADLVGGLVVGVIGIDVVRHVRGRRELRALAALPLMFAAHQLVESLAWWGARSDLPAGLGTLGLWLYLLFAFVVLPTYVPWAVRGIEPPGQRHDLMGALTAVGVVVSLALAAGMLLGPVEVRIEDHHLAYSTGLRAGGGVVGLYLLATCGSLLLSSERVVRWFGVVNVAAVAVLALLLLDGFASLWCGWAAVTSGAFALYLRREQPTLFAAPAQLS